SARRGEIDPQPRLEADGRSRLGALRSDGPTPRPLPDSHSHGGADAGAGRSSVGGSATDGVVRARKAAFRAAAEALVAVRAVVNQRRRFTSEARPASARIRAPRSKRRAP